MTEAEKLRAQLDELTSECRTLADVEAPTDEQRARLETILDTELQELEARTKVAEERAAKLKRVRDEADNGNAAPGADVPNQINRSSPFGGNTRGMERGELRDRALRAVELGGHNLSERQKVDLERQLRRSADSFDGGYVAERTLLTEEPHYRSAFSKLMQRNNAVLTAEEGNAVNAFRDFEVRTASEGTPSAGGYGIPVFIDPTIIITSGAADAPILDLMRKETITTNQWKGVTSAGVSWQYQAEGAVVTDNTPTLAQPTIPVYTARGFLPYTLEVEQDYPNFEGNMQDVLAQGYVNLVAQKSMSGTGTNEPWGIFNRMQGAVTPAHVTVTTAGVLDMATIRKAWAALPERFRSRASWLMNESVINLVRSAGNNLALADYTVNMTADGVDILTGRKVVVTDYAGATYSGVTTAYSYAIVGDFSQFIFVQRAGMNLELVPHLFDPATGFPNGTRGWFAWTRNGFDVATVNAFRLVSNT